MNVVILMRAKAFFWLLAVDAPVSIDDKLVEDFGVGREVDNLYEMSFSGSFHAGTRRPLVEFASDFDIVTGMRPAERVQDHEFLGSDGSAMYSTPVLGIKGEEITNLLL